MLIIVGFVVVILSVIGGYLLSHGELLALWQPYELIIIGGAAFGAFLVSNSKKVVGEVFRGIPRLLKGAGYKKEDYVAVLMLIYDLLQKMRKEGLIAIENDVENPHESPVFQKHPTVMNDHHMVEFITDCLRIMVSGHSDPIELEQLLDIELETHHHEAMEPAHALQRVADALPGFGIVAAVMGIVITMGLIGGEVSAIGKHVAAALVGTFLGILLAYGFVGPLAAAMETQAKEEAKAFEVVKMALIASLRGYSPAVAIEFARKLLFSRVRPSFADLETQLKTPR